MTSFPPGVPSVPITTRPPLGQAPSSWPMVIGILAIVFGVMAMIQSLFAALSPIVLNAVGRLMPKSQAASLAVAQKWLWWTYASGALAGVLGLLLLCAGVSILKRRRRAARLVRAWAGLKLLYALLAVAIGFFMIPDQLAAMRQDPNLAKSPVLSGPLVEVMMFVGVALGMLWIAALPVFMLVWLGRRKIKEELSSWS